MDDLDDYRRVQEEYKAKEWYKETAAKFRLRKEVREAKRRVQSSVSSERTHVTNVGCLTYPFALAELLIFIGALNLFLVRVKSSQFRQLFCRLQFGALWVRPHRSRPYCTDSVSLRAVGDSPPSASMEDIFMDEARWVVHDSVSEQ